MSSERVLVIDDSLVYRDIVVNHVLKPNEYKPLIAQDGQAGLETALQETPDLIIMDMEMPRMNGFQVLEALYEAGSQIPVIMMTLHGSEDRAVRAFRLGVRDYVIKPFSIEEMLEAMDRALTEVRLRRERDALMQQLDRERRQLEAVLTNTEDAIVLVDEAEKAPIILANRAACRSFGLEEHVEEKPLAQVIEDEMLQDLFYRARANNQTTHGEIMLPDDRTLNAYVTPIPGVGHVAVMQDITSLKELDRLKSEFVSSVSHDLRSPLTSIKGFADLLPMVGPLNEQQTHFLNYIQHGVETVTTMVSDLLDLGRIEAEVRMEMELCEIDNIVQKAFEAQKSQAALKKQALELDITPGLPILKGNPLRLGQVVTNLISNAIKYTPEGGHIWVSVGAKFNYLIITIKDDGIGIPPDDLPHIFEKFYRVSSAETERIIGSGLGLSIVQSIVEKHQGRIWARSQLGQGSNFTVVLPSTDA